MAKLNPTRTAYAVGLFAALLFLVWTLALLIGGQAFLDWRIQMHFIRLPATVMPVSIGTAVLSLVIHFILGAVIGGVFATVWNKVNK